MTKMLVFFFFCWVLLVTNVEATSLKDAIVEATKSTNGEAPTEGACPLDVLTCLDGSTLDRNPDLDCRFPRCTCKNTNQCMEGECVDGYCTGGTEKDDDDCGDDDYYCGGGDDDDDDDDDGEDDDYEPGACPQDVSECLDGSFVGRIPPYCEFEPCSCSKNQDCYHGTICDEEEGKCVEDGEEKVCPLDVLECLDGSSVSRLPPSCNFGRCTCESSRDCFRGICVEGRCSDRSVQCTLDVKECDDGSFVGRVPPDW